MKKHLSHLIISGAVVAMVAGCGGGSSDNHDTSTTADPLYIGDKTVSSGSGPDKVNYGGHSVNIAAGNSSSSNNTGSGSGTPPKQPATPPATTDIRASFNLSSNFSVPSKLQDTVKADKQTDALVFASSGKSIDKNVPNYDIGINGLEKSKLDKSYKQFATVLGYTEGNDAIYYRAPDATGWKYQTFGQVFKNNQSQGFVSVGVPQDISVLTADATYKGIAMGTKNNESELVGLMTATLSPSKKTLEVNISDLHIAEDNIKNRSFKDAKPFLVTIDIDQPMNWNASKHKFESSGSGSSSSAYIYGPKGEEIGGTFQQTQSADTYKGAFGGVRQP